MAILRIPTNFNIEIEFEIPEFYRRLIALLIDMLMQYFYLRIASEIYQSAARGVDGIDAYAVQLLLFLPVLLYHPVMEITMNGQSVGKKIMGIRVVNEIGGRPAISQFLIRWLLRVSDVWIALILLLLISGQINFRDAESTFLFVSALAFIVTDVVLVVSSRKSQRVGDILAKTILIRTNAKSSIDETVFVDVEDSYVPRFPQIMQLSDKDINAIKSIYETARRRGDFVMAETASQKIRDHLKIETSMSPVEFLEILLKDYNYLSTK
jgi:uncharacterized RDD family membrane protein YckC